MCCYAVLLFLACVQGSVVETNRVENDEKVPEFYIEHAISMSEAKQAAKSIDLSKIEQHAGCRYCTRQEIGYCLGPQLMNDHCCCDKKYNEPFPFVPHSCYLGEDLCKPIVRDCAEYERLRMCCCDKYVKEKWKEKSSASKPINGILLILPFLKFML